MAVKPESLCICVYRWCYRTVSDKSEFHLVWVVLLYTREAANVSNSTVIGVTTMTEALLQKKNTTKLLRCFQLEEFKFFYRKPFTNRIYRDLRDWITHKVSLKTGNKNVHLVSQNCCRTSWKGMLGALPLTSQPIVQQIRLLQVAKICYRKKRVVLLFATTFRILQQPDL